jgi:hypothetical protein
MTREQKRAKLRDILKSYAFAFADHEFLGLIKITSVGDMMAHHARGVCEIDKLSQIEAPRPKRDLDEARGVGLIGPANPIPGSPAAVRAAIRGLIEQTRRPA